MKRIFSALLAVFLLACALPVHTAAYEDSDYALWQAMTYTSLTSDLSSIVSADSADLAWGASYVINAYCRAYQATGEEIYLQKAGGYLYEIFQLAQDNDGDGYKNWGTGHYSNGTYEEFCVHTGAILSSAGEWANLVRSVPGILHKEEPTSGMAYGALCEYVVREATENMIPAFDKDWSGRIGLYMSPRDSVYFGRKRISLPNNQFLAMAAALIQFARLSPDHESQYLHRARRMLKRFHRKLWYNRRGDILRWRYRDWYFPCDDFSSKEDFSHGMWSARAAIMGYANGLVFTQDNIRAFARIYKSMVRGTQEEPLLAEYRYGGGTQDNTLELFIYDLSPFGDAIWSTGYRTAVFRNAVRTEDTARILLYHEAASAPLAFGLLAPENNTQRTGRTLFRWEPSVHACKYTLQISDRADFSSFLVNRADILDTSAFVEGLPSGKALYWRVISANQSGGTHISSSFAIAA